MFHSLRSIFTWSEWIPRFRLYYWRWVNVGFQQDRPRISLHFPWIAFTFQGQIALQYARVGGERVGRGSSGLCVPPAVHGRPEVRQKTQGNCWACWPWRYAGGRYGWILRWIRVLLLKGPQICPAPHYIRDRPPPSLYNTSYIFFYVFHPSPRPGALTRTCVMRSSSKWWSRPRATPTRRTSSRGRTCLIWTLILPFQSCLLWHVSIPILDSINGWMNLGIARGLLRSDIPFLFSIIAEGSNVMFLIFLHPHYE